METRLAVLVGIDHYADKPLKGCVEDVARMKRVLSRHADGSRNFQCVTVTSSEKGPPVTRDSLRASFERLFSRESADVVLFYFAGHGNLNRHRGAIMVTQDMTRHDLGVPLNDLLGPLSESHARQKIVIIDACYSGALGEIPYLGEHSILTENLAVLTASRRSETAAETDQGGLFTSLMVAALEGAAADVRGAVTIADAYSYASAILSGWQQRPLFKANIARLVSLRNCEPPVPDAVLRRLPRIFSSPDFELQLDPGYEPSSEPRDAVKEETFGVLQTLRDARLLIPSGGAKALYFAAMESRSCALTPLGKFYWQLSYESWI